MEYIKRLIDKTIEKRIQAFNALNIKGPKGCGKTRTCKERCKTVIEFQDVRRKEAYLQIADTDPTLFFGNDKPILFDEWQDAPKIWDAIRKECDDNPHESGSYFLTGSTSKDVGTDHTGTGRISSLTMYPMTLWESMDSNGSISLRELFEKNRIENASVNHLKLEDYFYLLCRGGWPRCLEINDNEANLEIGRDYYRQICNTDISKIDNVKRDPETARTLIWSYARNTATTAKKSIIYADVKANREVSDLTLASYVSALEKLFVVTGIDAWMPQIRSKTAIRSAKKHIFIDTSIITSALGISPEYFRSDLDTFGHIFENLVIRDLLAYAEAENAHVRHYRDDNGLEIDTIYELSDGRYALIEVKTGTNSIPEAEKNLLKFTDLIREHNEKVKRNSDHPGITYKEPSLMIVICANAPMAYTTKNNVHVIPFGCLKD